MPDRYNVIITPEATTDLVTVFSYIEQHSPQNATGVARIVMSAIDSLEILPHRYKIVTPRKDPSRSVHSMPVPPFLLYYRVEESRKTIHILTIRHGARRQPKRFD